MTGPRRLITLLGTGTYTPVRWYLPNDERRYESAYAPAATAALAGDVTDVAVLLTPEAEAANGDGFRRAMATVGIPVRSFPISLAADDEGIWRLFEHVIEAADGAREVIVDVTHSFRHLPFILFGSLEYEMALRGMSVAGVYYGAYEARRGTEAPLLDLTALLRLGEWVRAVRDLREIGNPRWLVRAVSELKAALWRRGQPSRALDHLRGALENLQWVLPAGLPLEAGLSASRAMRAAEDLNREQWTFRPLGRALDLLQAVLREIAIIGTSDKASVRLDQEELERQLRFARWLHTWGQDDRALVVLREWIINRSLLADGTAGRDWLDYGRARLPKERALRGLVERLKAVGDGSTKPDQAAATPAPAVAALWQSVTALRNPVAHAGFKPETVKPATVVERRLDECSERSRADADWRTAPPGSRGRLLVAPVGHSPGALFTAIVALKPDYVLAIVSPESQTLVDAACERAGLSLDRVGRVAVADAHACFGDVKRVLGEVRPWILEAREVCVSITGGTTAMQYLAERVANAATRLGIPTERYAMVDRRGADAQRQEPYVLGECVAVAGDAPAEDDGH